MKYARDVLYVLIPIIQIIFFVMGYDLINYAARKMGLVYSRGVGWGITVQMYAIEYAAIIMILGFLIYYVKKKALTFTIIAAVVFGMIIVPVLDSFPYRGGVIIVIGITGIFINYLFWLIKRKSKLRDISKQS
jgi:hypothetical protein